MKYNLDYIAATTIKTKIREESKKSHHYSGKLSHQIFKNAIVLPSLDYDENGILPGGIMNNGKLIESSAYAEYCCKTYPLNTPPVIVSGKVLFIGFFLHCYGHGITDNIKKLWWLKQNKWDAKIIYICERNRPLSQWQIEIFRLAGFNTKDWKQITVPTQYDEILIPDNSIINDHEFRYYTEEYKQIVNTIKQNTKSSSMCMIKYISHVQELKTFGANLESILWSQHSWKKDIRSFHRKNFLLRSRLD